MSDNSKNAEDASIRVVIGLGNPGREYEGTRHNVGFDIVDRMADNAGVSWQKERKWQALVARTGSVILVKPQTFMNLSGQTAAYIGGFFKMSPSQMLVVYDDVDLPLGALRFRANGSAGGHNGIKSMIQSLGSDSFPRLKFGIGHRPPPPGEVDPESADNQREGSMVSHVLGRFAVSERQEIEKSLAIAVDAVNCALARGLAAAMNQFNQKPSKPKKAKRQRPPRTSPESQSSETDATVDQPTENPSNPDISTPEAASENHPNPES